MKEPNLKNLKLDVTEAKTVNKIAKKSKKIKITINLDLDSLEALKTISGKTGVPYQRLLNQLLKESLEGQKETESRLERLEKEIKKIKRELAA
jgi:predicted DNA binding CopG/RHH family protein